MKEKATNFLRRHGLAVLLLVGILAYILVMGTTRSCKVCSTITDFTGISQPE
ncbi:MAG: hypothetical protein ACP5I4_15225 [Oceanipulchritudo sp.]